MNHEFNDNLIDAELQVRLMNLVLGEASDFERDQLQLLMEQRPELAAYFEHSQQLHAMLREVGAGESIATDDGSQADADWRLSAARRRKVLAVLDGVDNTSPLQNVSSSLLESRKWAVGSRWKAAVAAGGIACLLLAVLLLPSVPAARMLSIDAKSASQKEGEASGESIAADQLFDSSQIDGPESTGDEALPALRTAQVAGGPVSSTEMPAHGRSPAGRSGMSMGEMGGGMGGGPSSAARPDPAAPSNKVTTIGPLRSSYQELYEEFKERLGRDGMDDRDVSAESVDSEQFKFFSQTQERSFDVYFDIPAFSRSRNRSETSLEAEESNLQATNTSPELSFYMPFARRGLSSEKAIEQRLARRELSKKDKSLRLHEVLDEQSAEVQAFSTFSLHVSDVSFKLAQESLNQGKLPDANSIRIEEFVNAFDYRDPLPSGEEPVACRIEQAVHPFLMQRNVLRVSMRTAATGRANTTPLRLTLLLDNSGSMERIDRRQIVRRALHTLTQQLNANDRVTLICFASTPRLLADKVSGNQSETLLQIVENLPSEGGTNIESALQLAGEKAIEQRLAGAQNRIVLMTDGAVNLGDAHPASLSSLVKQLRDTGIAFDAAGVSGHELNDEVLEALTRQGDGRYYLLDSVESASESFSNQIAGALRPSAKNVKVQVEFNPQRVGKYQLLGFDNHRLNREDFRNDRIDAAELAAAEAGVALYHFEARPDGMGDVGAVSVRFRDINTDQMIEQRWPIPYEPSATRLEQANPSIRIATAAALLAAKLRGGPLADTVDLQELFRLMSTLPERDANQPRVEQLRTMIQQAKGE